METMNKMKLGLLLSCVAVLLTGCFGKKKRSETSKVEYSRTSSKKKKVTKKWDPNLEAYVFEGEENDEMLAYSNTPKNEFQKVYFDFDRTKIENNEQRAAAEYDAKLAKVKVEEGRNLVILGKSDTKCINENYNRAVSQNRADELAKEFTLAGVSRSHINAIGVGDTQLEVPVKGKEPLNRCAVVQVS